jgi:hypothetical protein
MANRNVNTTNSIFKDSKISEAELSANAIKEYKALATPQSRVNFYCDPAYHALYPNGFESTCQGVHIYLIFDGREVSLPKFIADYVEAKIKRKALASIDKKARNASKKQEYLGMEYVS